MQDEGGVRVVTLGVEEEFHVVEPRTRTQVPDAHLVVRQLPRGDGLVERELHAGLIETATGVCRSLAEVRADVTATRRRLVEAASRAGRSVIASGTAPSCDLRRQHVTPTARFAHMVEDYQMTAREQLISGCQTHVGVEDRDVAVQLLGRVRPWLPTLLALSASSPFWAGADTGYASYRSQVWARWPTYGVPGTFASAAEYDALVADLVKTAVISDEGMVYWDLRPSPRYATLEVRVADSCPTVDETVLQAGLARALVETAQAELRDGAPPLGVRRELVEGAKWRAARYGLSGDLVDAASGEVAPAAEVVRRLLAHVGPALEAFGDAEELEAIAERLLRDGDAAARQRRAFAERGDLADVVDLLVRETAAA